MVKPPVRAVLFDFDGTLVDSEPLHYEAWLHAVEPYGGKTGWDDYRARFVGKTDRWAAETFLSEARHPYGETLIAAVCDRKHAYFRQRSPERLAIPSETAQWISEALLDKPLGVVSSSLTRDVEPTIVKAGLSSRLDVLVCGEHVKNHKPDPEPYRLALELLGRHFGRIAAEQVLVFEDSESGAASARAAGMLVVPVDEPQRLVELAREALGC